MEKTKQETSSQVVKMEFASAMELQQAHIQKKRKEKLGKDYRFTVIGIPLSKEGQIDFRTCLWASNMSRRDDVISRYAVSHFYSQGADETIQFVLKKLPYATHIFLLSADMVPQNINCLDLMLDDDKDIVCGVSPIALPPPNGPCWNVMYAYPDREFDDSTFMPVAYHRLPEHLFPAYHSGGPYLIKRKVFEGMEWPYFKDVFEPGFRKLGQDLYFTAKARRSGFELYCEPRAQFDHVRTIQLKQMLDAALLQFGAKKAKGTKYYEQVYMNSEHYKGSYKQSPYYLLWLTIVELIKKEHPNPKILEIGCGTGQLAHYLHDEGFRNYSGFDFSKKAIRIAKKMSPQKFHIADIRDEKSYRCSYSLVIATEVFEHIEDDVAAIKKLKKGTPIIFTLPSFDDPAHLRYFAVEKQIAHRYAQYIDNLKVLEVKPWFLCYGQVKG